MSPLILVMLSSRPLRHCDTRSTLRLVLLSDYLKTFCVVRETIEQQARVIVQEVLRPLADERILMEKINAGMGAMPVNPDLKTVKQEGRADTREPEAPPPEPEAPPPPEAVPEQSAMKKNRKFSDTVTKSTAGTLAANTASINPKFQEKSDKLKSGAAPAKKAGFDRQVVATDRKQSDCPKAKRKATQHPNKTNK